MNAKVPSPCRMVIYTLDHMDAVLIQRARQQVSAGRRGSSVRAGDAFPAVVVRTWEDTGSVNLKVFLDGDDDHWVTSRLEATDKDVLGRWAWPAIR